MSVSDSCLKKKFKHDLQIDEAPESLTRSILPPAPGVTERMRDSEGKGPKVWTSRVHTEEPCEAFTWEKTPWRNNPGCM